ncbi:MAG: F0F1 ATP synthase subunit delta [Cyanobacteria bacterium QH_8_48_120]|jgi:F-type H+-transporting ATPase subunit delta|nr:MAG: F0F1 ATP synthase subunit delta [Cyanobacteria bacterium QH_1_48_107]PSO55841.1 MAG: F0F1 ATP synthase subunit delta [Cyanobacteria bacterium QH_10_48_56]PSO60410.1 MAG: F0F1 ATP synthase subunit delta [Cyanobacteria bacterium QH_7_48_89]PSO63763.1 MAG: F0F1 ATP synthase subunit delta [Cyanobacteria bacterium QH_2_48_84]PSO69151.1 MAG: F0F1 ATP synthase subunit delta [Cyanobacteria bacterium QH_6_48_35]PSO72453.1 MAG: F0F1 ATP synthase subunit delta [Cyanobacteria bacterium QH_3_48_40]
MKSSFLNAEIVEPYAEALMSLAQSNNLTDRFGEDVRSLVELLEESQQLQGFLGNPIITTEDKKTVLRKIGGEGTHPYLRNFLMLLADKKRLIFLEGIFQQYLALLRELNQTALAEVTSATELTEAQRQSISDKVKAMTNAQSVEIKTSIDPDLIGGVIIKVGSQVLDASLRGQLRRLGMNLKGAA